MTTNQAPVTTTNTVTTLEDTSFVLSASDFPFSDADVGDTLQSVTIVAPPAVGTLLLNGVAVSEQQVVSLADINDGLLVFTPAADANGAAYSSFTFQVSDGASNSNESVLTFDVTAVNDAPTFDGPATGQVVTDINGYRDDYVRAVAMQADGKILVGGASSQNDNGNQEYALVRYNPDGSIDSTFNFDRTALTSYGLSSISSLTMQDDGKIIFAGFSDDEFDGNKSVLVRLNSDGSLDTTLGGSGEIVTAFDGSGAVPYSVVVQDDGKIVVSGALTTQAGFLTEETSYIIRYNADGSLDTTFNESGVVTTHVNNSGPNDVVVQSDGSIVVGGGDGADFSLVSYNSDGSLNTSFGTNGTLTTDFGGQDSGVSMEVQSDGKIVLVGQSLVGPFPWSASSTSVMARYNADGSLDSSFGTGGKVSTNFISSFQFDMDQARDIKIQPDGKIVVCGSEGVNIDGSISIAVCRYNTDGSLDSSFGNDGTALTSVDGVGIGYGLALQSDGKIVVVGDTFNSQDVTGDLNFLIARFNNDGSLDTTFGIAPDTLAGSPSYIPGENAVVLDSDVTIFDIELHQQDNYAGSTLTLVRHDGADNHDIFSASGTLSFENGALTIDGITIGSVSNINGTLILTFNSDSTQTLVNGAIQKIAYSYDGGAPPSSLQIDWAFDDGSHSENAVVTGHTTVDTTPVALNNSVSTNEDSQYIIQPDDFKYTDINSGSLTSITIASLPTAGTLRLNGVDVSENQVIDLADVSAGHLIYMPAENYNGSDYSSFDFKVNEGANDSNSATLTLDVNAVNDAPRFSGFGTGKLTTDFGNNTGDYARSINLQADGKIVVGGYTTDSNYFANYSPSDFALARYNSDGRLDITFNTSGKVITDFGGYDFGNSTVVQADGKIVLGGYSSGSSGYISGHLFAIARYNDDGSLDTTFNGSGKVTTDFGGLGAAGYSLTAQADGKILVEGRQLFDNGAITVARYNSDGSLDATFNVGGTATTELTAGLLGPHGIAVQQDGKILMAGQFGEDFAVTRLNSDGSSDTSFGVDGLVTTDIDSVDSANSITIQSDGKILLAGYSFLYSAPYNGNQFDFAIARYNSDGSLDTSFGAGGKVSTDLGIQDILNSITLQNDGKILVCGRTYVGDAYDFTVVRYNEDGSLDTSFSDDGVVRTDFHGGVDNSYSIVVQTDGKILVAGESDNGISSDFAVARYNSDGSLDATFNAVHYTIGGSAVVLDSYVTISDVELSSQDNFSGSTLTLTRHGGANIHDFFSGAGSLSFEGGVLSLDASEIGSVINSNGSLMLQFDSNATQSVVNAVIHQISYSNDSGTPSENIQIDWTFDDGSGADNSTVNGQTTVNVEDNIAPQAADSTVLIDEDNHYALRASDFRVGDANGDALQLVITGLPTSGSLQYLGSDVTVNQVITLADITSEYSEYLVFTPAENANGIGYSGFTFKVNDGLADSNEATVTIDVAPVNDAPTFSIDDTNTLGGTPTFTYGGSAVVLDSDVQIFDVELSAQDNFAGSTLTLVSDGGANANDVFSATGNLSFSSGILIVNATTIGAVSNSGGTLTFTLNSSATQSLVDSAMQQIAYSYGGATLPSGEQIDWTFNDGSGADNAAVTGYTTVSITAITSTINGTSHSDVLNGDRSATASFDTIYGFNGNDVINGKAGNDTLYGGAGKDVLRGGAGNDILSGGADGDKFIIDSTSGFDTILDFTTKADKIVFDMSDIGHIGNGDAKINSGAVRSVPGGFASSSELVLFTNHVAGDITADNAATVIGSAKAAYHDGDLRLFVVGNGVQSNIYQFDSHGSDALVSGGELTLIGVVNGSLNSLGDFLFQL